MHEEAHTSQSPELSFKKWMRHHASGATRLLVTFLVLVDVFMGLYISKEYISPFASTWKDYLISTGDVLVLWTGRLFWIFIVVLYVLVPIVRGKAPRLIEPFELLQRMLDWARRTLNKKVHAIGIAVALLIIFVCLLVLLRFAPTLASPVSGHLVVPTLPGDFRLFLVQDGSVKILNRTSFTVIQTLPHIDSLENIAVTKDLKRIFATDFTAGKLHELSWETGQETNSIDVGHSASGIALSADGRKLYVAVQGPIPEGKILVFDAEGKLNPNPITSVSGLGCPISLFSASRAPRLFVATQCGGGLDPVYVIDTRSDEIIAKVPGFAVGIGIVATPDGKKAIVSTGDSIRTLEDYTSASPKTTIKRMPVGPMAVTQDGKLLLVGTPPGLRSFDLNNDNQCAEVGLEAVPSAMAVTADGAVYAQLPNRFFVTDVGALSCKTSP
jgi:WD40 repeat protein